MKLTYFKFLKVFLDGKIGSHNYDRQIILMIEWMKLWKKWKSLSPVEWPRRFASLCTTKDTRKKGTIGIMGHKI